jgi:hypothetical protein
MAGKEYVGRRTSRSTSRKVDIADVLGVCCVLCAGR